MGFFLTPFFRMTAIGGNDKWLLGQRHLANRTIRNSQESLTLTPALQATL